MDNNTTQPRIYTEVIGNMHAPEWKERLSEDGTDYVFLDQWTAQKSRFLAKGVSGREYPVALKRHTQVTDGDIIDFDPATGRASVLRIELNPVLVIDLDGLKDRPAEEILRRSVELGHAIGNQHWPAVVKGTKVYVPLTVDKKVMLSVMETHHLEGVEFKFEQGLDVIPYMAPHEIRRLFGGAGHESHAHVHADPNAEHHHHPHTHVHFDENGIAHEHCH